VMGAFAEFERALIRKRQREGIALAQKRGAYRGQKIALSAEWLLSFGSGSLPASRRPSWGLAGKRCINHCGLLARSFII
jgi:hypothetical protein